MLLYKSNQKNMSLDYPPKSGNEIRFNPDNFKQATDALTLKDADQRYLRLSGGSIIGSLVIGGNLDIQTLSINGGSTLDLSGLSYITDITPGTAIANKALVIDSSRNITNINTITTTNVDIGSNLTYGGSNINLNLISGITPGVALASKALIIDSSKRIFDLGEINFSPSATNKVSIKKSITGNGIYFYDLQSSSPAPVIEMLTANQTSPTYIRLDCASAPNSYSIAYTGGSAFTSGLRISCTNTSTAADVNSNVMLSARNSSRRCKRSVQSITSISSKFS
jgi:hypothetical protein